MHSINEHIPLNSTDVTLYVKREDRLHPFISGNKFRKLKYSIQQAKSENKESLLTFGGAFSNHIAAVAAAGREYSFKTIGFIRGEELAGKVNENPTLSFAQSCGMRLEFLSREEYRNKTDPDFLHHLSEEFGDSYIIPEGGTNALAIAGCEEILTSEDSDFDYICCAVGTGGTIAGLINSAAKGQTVLGFPALKGDFIENQVGLLASGRNFKIIDGYEFGGYGKVTPELIKFINEFNYKHRIPLDPIYTGKMLFGVMDLISEAYFEKGAKILVIHTGGLQGIMGMNLLLKNKNLPLIEIDNE